MQWGIFESLPLKRVPILAPAQRLGIAVRDVEAIVQLARVIRRTGYWRRGQTPDKLGVDRPSAGELTQFTMNSERCWEGQTVFMIMLVLNDASHIDNVFAAWAEAGATVITAVESFAPRPRSTHGVVHARYNVENLSVGTGQASTTLFGVVADAADVQRCQAATEAAVGDLALSGAGVWAAWPLAALKGTSLRATH